MLRLVVSIVTMLALALPVAAWEVPATMLVGTKVRYEPLPDAKVLDDISKGTEVLVLQCVPSGTWCKIRFPGEDGWVKAETFDRLADIHREFCRPGSTKLLCTLH